MNSFLYKTVLIMRELRESNLFLASVAVLVFGFAVAMRTLPLTGMTPNVFSFITGLSIGFLVMAGLTWLSKDSRSSATPQEEAEGRKA